MRWLLSKIARIAGWFRRLPVTVKVGMGAVLVVLIFGGSYASYRIYDYTQNDPEFCRSCHTMETAWERWSTSEHSRVDCHACHHVSPVQGAQLIVGYLLERPDINEEHAHIPDQACEQCHYSGEPTWVQVASTAGHEAHAEEQNIACQTCHGLRLHEFHPTTEICVACHADHVAGQEMAIKMPDMRDMHCVECHPFLREDSPIRPTRDTCLECHQKLENVQHPVTFPNNDVMMWDCRECHKPHQAEGTVVDCLSCHTDIRNEGLHAGETHAGSSCTTCHQPHEWIVSTRDACTTCHSDKVEHNAGTLCSDCHEFGSTISETASSIEIEYPWGLDWHIES